MLTRRTSLSGDCDGHGQRRALYRDSRISARSAPAQRPTSPSSSFATGEFESVDNENVKRTGKRRLFATAAIIGGKKA